MITKTFRYAGPFAGPSKRELYDEIDKLSYQCNTTLMELLCASKKLRDLHKKYDDLRFRPARRLANVMGNNSEVSVENYICHEFNDFCFRTEFRISRFNFMPTSGLLDHARASDIAHIMSHQITEGLQKHITEQLEKINP